MPLAINLKVFLKSPALFSKLIPSGSPLCCLVIVSFESSLYSCKLSKVLSLPKGAGRPHNIPAARIRGPYGIACIQILNTKIGQLNAIIRIARVFQSELGTNSASLLKLIAIKNLGSRFICRLTKSIRTRKRAD